MSAASSGFVCSICGKSHAGLPTDWAYTLPDAVWAIPEEERAAKAKWTSDLCQMGEEYFIRCLLPVPFTEREGYFGWGVWTQVDWGVFERYLQLYELDGTREPEVRASLANDLPSYEPLVGAPVLLQFGASTQRPTLRFPSGSTHSLAAEQAAGINALRYHQILEAVGAFK